LTIENLQNHFNFEFSVFKFFLRNSPIRDRLLIHDTYEPTGFVLRILWCSQSGHDPENNLAKFRYILDMELGKENRIPLYSWLHTGTYHKNLAIWNFFLFEIWRIWVKFSMKNPLHRSKAYFSGRILAKIRQ
jgi:hypothetical protein